MHCSENKQMRKVYKYVSTKASKVFILKFPITHKAYLASKNVYFFIATTVLDYQLTTYGIGKY